VSLADLAAQLRAAPGVGFKQDIQAVADVLRNGAAQHTDSTGCAPILNGDDAAAIPDGDGYILLAAEGMLPSFVAADPWFAGFCSVMVNVNDILAMGGTPRAIVDVLFAGEGPQKRRVLEGMRDAARAYRVPVVGGHTSRLAGDSTLLAAAIVGKARKLITSFAARPGDELIMAVDLRGAYRGDTNNFDAASAAQSGNLQMTSRVLPQLSDAELVHAGKDISMAGIAGTLTMLCEASGVGAVLELGRLPRPAKLAIERWLVTFPSFGFLLAVDPAHSAAVHERFVAAGVTSATVGKFQRSRRVELAQNTERAVFWNLEREPFTGFGADSMAITQKEASDA
jgi:AIR synthase-related protein